MGGGCLVSNYVPGSNGPGGMIILKLPLVLHRFLRYKQSILLSVITFITFVFYYFQQGSVF